MLPVLRTEKRRMPARAAIASTRLPFSSSPGWRKIGIPMRVRIRSSDPLELPAFSSSGSSSKKMRYDFSCGPNAAAVPTRTFRSSPGCTDRTVGKNKGREPITDEATRVDLVSAIRHVDLAILGNQGGIYDTLEKVRPDIVALGYDQHHNAEEIEREGRRRGIDLQTRRLSTRRPDLKTTKILAEFR